ncbi:MAG: DNA alkylation repair protein [Clostridia bacterium]|nr:DNA alkylation repair protein [Clostridia bacterium]
MNREEILNEMNKLADKKWGEEFVHKSIIGTKASILGVRTPDMRALARKIAKTDLESAFLALKDDYFEENLLYGFLLGYVGDMDETYHMLIDFLPRIDNWAVCDQTCSSLKIFKNDKDNNYFKRFLNLAQNENEFYARVGIVMLMLYYLKDECIDKILENIVKIENHAYYVDMAVAWLISFAIIKYKSKTFDLIKSQKLQKRVQNKAICKCRDSFRVKKSLKEQLKEYRIK